MVKTGNTLRKVERAIRGHKHVDVPDALEIKVQDIGNGKRVHLSIDITCNTKLLPRYLDSNHFLTFSLGEAIGEVYPTKELTVRISDVAIFSDSVHVSVYAHEDY